MALLPLVASESDVCMLRVIASWLRNEKSKRKFRSWLIARLLVLLLLVLRGDTIRYVNRTNGSYANFSLNPESDTSRFYILTADTVEIGKIAIVHTNRNEFVNAECGVRTLSTIDTVLIENASEGDSVAILFKDVDENYDNGNIEIFLAGFE